MDANVWLGAQGWQYRDWIGPFYPPGTAVKDMLIEYARVFPTVEVDSTYYGAPARSTVEGWRRRSPDAFRFALKTPSEITHELRFVGAEAAWLEFLDRVRLLGPKLAAVLIQCPPDFAPSEANRSALERFLRSHLPGDIPFALELRDERWYDAALFALVRECSLTPAITEGVHADLELARKIVGEIAARPPAGFAYVRWLGDRALTRYDRVQIDRGKSLDEWERLIRTLRGSVRDIYGYANNHYQGHSPETVRAMLARLGEPLPPETTSLRLL